MLTTIWYQVSPSNTFNLYTIGIKYFYLILIVHTQLYSFKYSHLILVIQAQLYNLKYSFLKVIIFKQVCMIHWWDLNKHYTLDQSGTWSNGNEGVLHTSQHSRTGASLQDTVYDHRKAPFYDGSYPSVEDPIDIFLTG